MQVSNQKYFLQSSHQVVQAFHCDHPTNALPLVNKYEKCKNVLPLIASWGSWSHLEKAKATLIFFAQHVGFVDPDLLVCRSNLITRQWYIMIFWRIFKEAWVMKRRIEKIFGTIFYLGGVRQKVRSIFARQIARAKFRQRYCSSEWRIEGSPEARSILRLSE